MTVEQFVSDLDELIDSVCERLGKTKVAIFGHSWGSALGVLYAARFPGKVAAYVGSGQVGDWAAGESAWYAFALAKAQRLGNRRAIRKLRAIGPPPHIGKAVFTERACLSRLEGRMRLGPCGRWRELFSAGRSSRSSSCPAACAASGLR
jgi:pimeloyl-ACP methyl ester carboxylesterase